MNPMNPNYHKRYETPISRYETPITINKTKHRKIKSENNKHNK